MNTLFDSKINNPRISLILLDWTCRESFHIFEYLKNQTVSRDSYEIIWIEYYGKEANEIEELINHSKQTSEHPPLDKWIVMGIPDNVYYHKHLMYNVGIAVSKGNIVCIMDSDAIVSPTFIESIITKFENEKNIVLHLDEVRNIDKKHYPFDYPSIDEVLQGQCKNWNGVTTTGLENGRNPLLTRNYGACMCALKNDLIEIGGADEHIDFLGHVCGPYDMTFRLVNNGRREIWHNTEYLYHAWHPGTDGDNNYIGPHDGRNNSLPALEAKKSGRVMPLTENGAIKILRESNIASETYNIILEKLINHDLIESWKIDEFKKKISLARQSFYSSNFQGAVLLLDEIHDLISDDSILLGYSAWANYVTGRFLNALNLSNEALILNPENCIARKTLGWIYYRRHDYEKAVIEFAQAINSAEETNDENILEILRGKAWVNFHLGKYGEAKEDFNKALDYIPSDRSDIFNDMKRGLELSGLYLSSRNSFIRKLFGGGFSIKSYFVTIASKFLSVLNNRYLSENNAGENTHFQPINNPVPVEKVLLNANPEKWESHKFGLPDIRWKRLEGKSFWITGGGTGYGQAIAVALAAANGKVFISGRRMEKLLETVAEAENYGIDKSNIIPVQCDITDEESVKAACRKIESMCSSLYGLINNAALSVTEGPFPFENISLENWNHLLATNVTGQWLVTKNIFGHMSKGGSVRVIFMTSEAGWAFTPGYGPYNVTKAALNNLAVSMAEEYELHYPKIDIQMNTVVPGEAKTEMNRGSHNSPYSVVSIVLSLLSHPAGGPNGMFFHRDGRHYSFAYRNKYQKKIL